MTVQLKKFKVEIKEEISWGERELINAEYAKLVKPDMKSQEMEMSLEGVFDVKYKALEICVISITNLEGEKIAYSKDWAFNLSQEDGNKLYEAVDNVITEKKN